MTPTVTNLCLGTAPDSWGVWFPDDRRQVPYSRFLDEAVDAGYRWIELGPYGYLPTDARQLAEELAARDLQVSGGTAAGALHRPQTWDDIRTQATMVATVSASAGAQHLVFLPSSYRDLQTGEFTEAPELTSEQWRLLADRANELGRMLREEYGIALCLHPHADSHIQTRPEIDRFLDLTDSRYVNLCLDTGHVAYGGGDALDVIDRYAERIGYVHLKQLDPDVLTQVRMEDLSFADAVRRGVCVEPPSGVPDPGRVIEALSRLDRELFAIVEQDLFPCTPETPLPIAVRTRAYLATRGLTGTRRPAAAP